MNGILFSALLGKDSYALTSFSKILRCGLSNLVNLSLSSNSYYLQLIYPVDMSSTDVFAVLKLLLALWKRRLLEDFACFSEESKCNLYIDFESGEKSVLI